MKIKVNGMKCCGCERRVVSALENIGVSAVADHENGTVEIKNPPMDMEEVYSTIEKLGYKVER